MSALIPLLLCVPVFGHMSMQFPYPRDNGGTYAAWQANEPMVAVHPEVCHGLAGDTTVRTGNAFAAGDTIAIDMYGSASHDGGHCAFWYSTDDTSFTKIIDVKDCTLSAPSVTLPVTMPVQCTTKCTFAFTWVPRSSGACEIYMNCADISVSGAQGGNSDPIELNFQTEFIDKAASGYGCVRVDDTTHWTSIFGELKTEYDDTDTVVDNDIVVTVDPDEEADTTGCFQVEALAINIDNEIATDGTCGSDAGSNRCDDGQCCSAAGYCGPDYDGTGYLNYDSTDPYYDSAETAFAAYCTNALGNWRIVDDCATTPSPTAGADATPSPTDGDDATPSPTAGADVTPSPTSDDDDNVGTTKDDSADPEPSGDASGSAYHAPAFVFVLLALLASQG